MKKIALAVMALSAVVLFTACNKDGEPKGGSFKVRMTDAPADYEALNMTLLSVEAYNDTKGWITLEGDSKSFNVLDLTNGRETTLAFDTDVKSGVYTLLRLRFGDENSINYQSTSTVGGVSSVTTASANLQWNGAREVIIPISASVSSSVGADLLLDFDVASSVTEVAGTFIINPVIKVMTNASTGIEGRVNGSSNALVTASNGSMEASTYIDASGEFMIRGLKDGSYVLTIKSCAEDRAEGAAEEITIDGVIVANGEITAIGSVNLQ